MKAKIGKPVIELAKCVMCNECISVCHRNAIKMRYNQACNKCIKYCISYDVPCNPEMLVICHESCDSCGECVTACKVNAIHFIRMT